jgi:hypothetical protein
MPHQNADVLIIPSLFWVRKNGDSGLRAVIALSIYLIAQIKLDRNVAVARRFINRPDRLDLGRPTGVAGVAMVRR